MRETSWLRDELERAKAMGLTVQIEGRTCTYSNPEELLSILEEPTYMLDYLSDDEGKITGICFDRVNERDFIGKADSGTAHKD